MGMGKKETERRRNSRRISSPRAFKMQTPANLVKHVDNSLIRTEGLPSRIPFHASLGLRVLLGWGIQ
jgi:hypothetical protein